MTGQREVRQDVEDLLRALDEARQKLSDAVERLAPERFTEAGPHGRSAKQTLDRTYDELTFKYGRLIARAFEKPQQHCLPKADFGTLREAAVSLAVAHRRLVNMLHDLQAHDLERVAFDEQYGRHTLQQVMEMTAGFYHEQEREILAIVLQSGPDGD